MYMLDMHIIAVSTFTAAIYQKKKKKNVYIVGSFYRFLFIENIVSFFLLLLYVGSAQVYMRFI